MQILQKKLADELSELQKILLPQEPHQPLTDSNPFKQELLNCKCTFHGSIQRTLLLLKLKVSDFISSNQSTCQQAVAPQESALHRNLRKSLRVLNSSIQNLLHDGILTLYIQLNQAKEEFAKIKATKMTENLIKLIINSMDSLLRAYFVFQEYNIRNGIKDKHRENNIYSLKTLPTLHQNGSEGVLDNELDEKLIEEIQKEISKKPLGILFEEQMRKQKKKISESEQVCRICFQSVRLNNLQKHVNNCAKKNNLKLELQAKNQQIKQLQFKLRQQYQQSCEECVHEDIDEDFRKICKLILHFNRNGERKTHKRCSLIGVKSEVNIGQRIEKYIESYLEEFGRHQLLASLLEQYRQRNLIQKRINSIEISSLFSDQNEEDDDFDKLANKKPVRRSNSKNHTALVGSNSKSIFCEQANHKSSNKNIQTEEKDHSSDQSSDLDQQENCSSRKRMDTSLKKLQTKRSLSRKNEKDLCDDLQCDVDVVRHYSSLHNIVGKPQEKDECKANIKLQDFQILQFLGQGAFGKVYLARRRQTKDVYALKIIKISEDYSQKELLSIKNQHEIFKKIAGDHLVKAPFSFSANSCHIFVLQFLPGGDLRKLLTDQIYFQEYQAKYYIAEIILAIQHLHKYGIIHRDLKPENLVIDRKGHLKLTDFGLSQFQVNKKLTQSRKEEKALEQVKASRNKRRRAAVYGVNKQNMQLIGTPDYIAPEIINQTSFSNYTIDWWSLGVMAYELIIGTRPFCADTIEEVITNITNFNIEWPEVGEEEGMITPEAKDFIMKLLNKDFSQRLGANGANEIKLHPFLSGIDWVNLKTSSKLFMPRRLTKFSELVGMQEDKKLRKQIEDFLEQGKKRKNLQLQTFIRFDLLKSQTIENMQKKQEQTRKKLKRLRTLREISNQITLTTQE